MPHNLEIPKLEDLALHEMAKNLWNVYARLYPRNIFIGIPGYLQLYEERVLKILAVHLPPRFPELWKDKLVDAMLDIKLSHDSVYHWATRYRDIIKLSEDENWDYVPEVHNPNCFTQDLKTTFKNLTNPTGRYQANRFIKLLGQFDDLSWVKMFIADENQSLKSRFYLACVYCLEDDIRHLWRVMKTKNQTLLEKDFDRISDELMSLVKLWIKRLRGETGVNFPDVGWNLAFHGCHEHAAIFFWNLCSDDGKAKILLELNKFRYLIATKNDHVGFVHFIYSVLPEDSKYSLVRYWGIGTASALVFMLCSSHYKSILNDILLLPHSVSLDFYKCILESLASAIQESAITRHREIFEILWNRLVSEDERVRVLTSSKILAILSNSNHYLLIELIVLPLPRWFKEKILLSDFQMASPMNFSLRKDYEGYFRYLLILLIDYDGANQKLRLVPDAENLLERYTHGEIIRNVTERQLQKGNWIVKHLVEILPVVDYLINRMDSDTVPYIFLRKKIYPLFPKKKLKSRTELRYPDCCWKCLQFTEMFCSKNF